MENGVAKHQFQRGSISSKNNNTKPKFVDYFKVPDECPTFISSTVCPVLGQKLTFTCPTLS